MVEVQIPSQQTGNSKFWVRISRGIEHHARLFILTEIDHPNPEAASSQQSISCGVTASTGNMRKFASQIQSCANTEVFFSICFSQRVLEIDTSKSVNPKGNVQTIFSDRCLTVVLVVFMDMVIFIKVFMIGFFVIANMATITMIYFM